MPLKGRAKRNRNRTVRYGNFRQIYYNFLGICAQPGCGAVDNLEIHEETDGISEIKFVLLCIDCHCELEHQGGRESRRYLSMLSEDISAEMLEYGGLRTGRRHL